MNPIDSQGPGDSWAILEIRKIKDRITRYGRKNNYSSTKKDENYLSIPGFSESHFGGNIDEKSYNGNMNNTAKVITGLNVMENVSYNTKFFTGLIDIYGFNLEKNKYQLEVASSLDPNDSVLLIMTKNDNGSYTPSLVSPFEEVLYDKKNSAVIKVESNKKSHREPFNFREPASRNHTKPLTLKPSPFMEGKEDKKKGWEDDIHFIL